MTLYAWYSKMQEHKLHHCMHFTTSYNLVVSVTYISTIPAPIVDFNFQDDDSLKSSRTPSFTPTPGYLQTQKKTI